LRLLRRLPPPLCSSFAASATSAAGLNGPLCTIAGFILGLPDAGLIEAGRTFAGLIDAGLTFGGLIEAGLIEAGLVPCPCPFA
jgi:hypothetical protein